MIYTDFEWPLRFNRSRLAEVNDESYLKQKVEFQTLTRTSEIIFTEDGSEVAQAVFEPNDEVTDIIVSDSISDIFDQRIPEAKLRSITVSPEENTLRARVAYTFSSIRDEVSDRFFNIELGDRE